MRSFSGCNGIATRRALTSEDFTHIEDFWAYVSSCEEIPKDENLIRSTDGVVFSVSIVRTVRAFDPNEKVGPAGVGADGYLPAEAFLPYTIYFENEASKATAAAQEVFITDVLDPNLDWTTIELGSFGFSGREFALPAGLQSYRGRVNAANPDGSPLFVDVEIDLDPTSGVLSWTFRSVEPATGALPEDPFAGFLPVNDATGKGEGFVRFLARSHAGLDTGTPIENTASIVFDLNDAIVTNTTRHTIDADAPIAFVESLPATSTATSFPVTWAGSDGNGSGISLYSIYVSTDGGPYAAWLLNTTLLSSTFTGEVGRHYAFFLGRQT